MTSPLRVLRRFQARQTQQTQHLEQVLQTVGDALNRALPNFGFSSVDREPSRLEGIAQTLARVSQEALKELRVTFDNPKRQEAAKHYLTRLRNLTQMIGEWAKATTWEEMSLVLKKQQTKSKSVREKYWEYAREAIGLVSYFDTEHEETVRVGPWTVMLFSAKGGDWSRETYGKLEHILREVTKVLARVGVGEAAGGEVYAYPTAQLPGSASSPGALASYNIPTGRVSLAANADPAGVVLHLTHEIGHKAYFQDLSGNAREAWKAFFDSESGTPDVDQILKAWQSFLQKPSYEAQKYGRYTAYFANDLKKTDPDMFMWVNLIFSKLPDTEKFDPITGSPKKGSKPGLDILIENRDKIRVFLHPVTAYSGKDADECFAEVFSLYAVEGPGRIPEIVRDVFQRCLPRARTARRTPAPR